MRGTSAVRSDRADGRAGRSAKYAPCWRPQAREARLAMSRGNALCHTLQAAPGEFDTRSVPATGDCFFDALDLQLPAEGRADELLSAGQMRDTVADSLNEEILCATKPRHQIRSPWIVRSGGPPH